MQNLSNLSILYWQNYILEMPKEIQLMNKLHWKHPFIQKPEPLFIELSMTEPLQKQQNLFSEQQKYQKNQGNNQKLFKNSSKTSNPKKQSNNSTSVLNNKTHKNPKKAKSIALQTLREYLSSKQLLTSYETTEKNKVIINSNFSQEMRKRNAISEMRHYKVSTKNEKQEEKSQIKKGKKRKSTDAIKIIRREQKDTIEIIPNYTAVSQPRKKQTKPVKKLSQQASTFSARQPKLQFKSMQLHRQRKCKSSLREENTNMINTLKQIGKTLPIPSKLNSLYSNTTSIYNSYSDIQIIQRKIAQRIPTQEPNQEIQQIRQYQSMALSRQKSLRSLRNTSKKLMIQQLPQTIIEIQPQKTENIINNFLQKIKIQSEFEIVQPRSIEEVQQMYNDTSLNGLVSKEASVYNSIIEQLQKSSRNPLDDSRMQLQKLNEIVSIIQKSNNDQIAEKKDKEYILQTIKSILSNKKHQSIEQQIRFIDKYELNEAKTKTFLNTSSLNTSSLHQSLSSENVSQINLQILDKALREREIYLNGRLQKQLEKIEDRKNEGLSEKDIQQQIDRTTKWITHQIKEVHHTRTQLWKGFNVAKNLLRDEIGDKNKQMMKCLSQKYINTWRLFSKPKKANQGAKKQQNLQQNELKKLSTQQKQFQEMQPRIVGDSDSDCQDNDKKINNLAVPHEDIKFLSSNSSYIDYQQQNKDSSENDLSYRQDLMSDDGKFSESQKNYSSPPWNRSKISQLQDSEALQFRLKKIQQFQEKTIEKALQRQRLDCQTPQSDSQNQSYGAVIIERQDTFLFSSDKKSQSSIIDLTIQDKEDICQFIFLDLCIEMTQQNPVESKVIKQLLNFINKVKEQSRRAKGFKTNTVAIKEYLTNFIAFLKTKPQIVGQIHSNIQKPMGPTALQILRYMHSYSDEAQQENEPFVLTARVFDCFEDNYMRALKIQRFYDDEDKQARRRNFLKNAIHIHNKAIYDAYNQTLDKHRPFGIWGEPFSWKKVPKFHHERGIKQKNDIIVKSAQQTIQYSNFMCGFIADKQGSTIKDNPQISQAYIQQVRYDRLSQMMARQLQQSQERMCFFDDEETQILVDLAQFIFHLVLEETVQQFRTFI